MRKQGLKEIRFFTPNHVANKWWSQCLNYSLALKPMFLTTLLDWEFILRVVVKMERKVCPGHDGSTDSGLLAQLRFQFWTRHLLNMRPWVKNLIFLSLSFLVCRTVSVISTTSDRPRTKGDKVHKASNSASSSKSRGRQWANIDVPPLSAFQVRNGGAGSLKPKMAQSAWETD